MQLYAAFLPHGRTITKTFQTKPPPAPSPQLWQQFVPRESRFKMLLNRFSNCRQKTYIFSIIQSLTPLHSDTEKGNGLPRCRWLFLGHIRCRLMATANSGGNTMSAATTTHTHTHTKTYINRYSRPILHWLLIQLILRSAARSITKVFGQQTRASS